MPFQRVHSGNQVGPEGPGWPPFTPQGRDQIPRQGTHAAPPQTRGLADGPQEDPAGPHRPPKSQARPGRQRPYFTNEETEAPRSRRPARLRRPSGSRVCRAARRESGPQAGGGSSPRSRRRTLARPLSAHRLLPGAAPSGGRVGMGLGTTTGGPGRTTALTAPSPAAAVPRDRSPISARSRRCRATVRPQMCPGCPPASRTSVPRMQRSGPSSQCGQNDSLVAIASPSARPTPRTLVLLTLCAQSPCPTSSLPTVSPTPLPSSHPPCRSHQTSLPSRVSSSGDPLDLTNEDPRPLLAPHHPGERTPSPGWDLPAPLSQHPGSCRGHVSLEGQPRG